jgi:hypothetical protein
MGNGQKNCQILVSTVMLAHSSILNSYSMIRDEKRNRPRIAAKVGAAKMFF